MVMKRARKEKKHPAVVETVAGDGKVKSQSSGEDLEYTEGKWKGLPHFQCNKCPYSTLDEKLMQEHADDHKKREKRVKK